MNWEHMSSPIVILAWLFGISLVLVPIVLIVRKAGYSGWWPILALFLSLFPPVNLALLWIFAFARWPLEDRAESK